MPRLSFIDHYLPNEEQQEALFKCFSKILSEPDFHQLLTRINHSLCDFFAFKKASRRGSKRERLFYIKQEVIKLKKWETSTFGNEFISYKEKILEQIQNERPRKRGSEDDGPLFLLKCSLFNIYDSYESELTSKISNGFKERSISKKIETIFYCNKAAFISLIKDKNGNNFAGYIHNLKPLNWNPTDNPKNSHHSVFDTSLYRDARKHSLGKFIPPNSNLLIDRQYVPENTDFFHEKHQKV